MPPVTVYSKPNCQPCKMTKQRFKDNGIEFVEIDISEDADAREYVLGLGALAAPVVVVGDLEDHWAGFKPDKIKELIARNVTAVDVTKAVSA